MVTPPPVSDDPLTRLLGAREFECWNPCCPWYAGHGQRLKISQVWYNGQAWQCRTCQSHVRPAPAAAGNANALAGLAGGALVGGAFGGAPGAVIGALIGLILGTSSARGQ